MEPNAEIDCDPSQSNPEAGSQPSAGDSQPSAIPRLLRSKVPDIKDTSGYKDSKVGVTTAQEYIEGNKKTNKQNKKHALNSDKNDKRNISPSDNEGNVFDNIQKDKINDEVAHIHWNLLIILIMIIVH